MKLLKSAIWAYFLLLLFEGALRKWVFPGLASPLLLVREPVLLAIYLLALARGRFPLNGWVVVCGCLGGLAVVLSLLFSDAPWQVTAFGWRATFLHVPLIFVMGAALDRDDVVSMGRVAILTAIPMAAVVFMQFTTPVNSIWNITPGGGEAMKSAFDRARASGTFSFATGLASFAGLACAFLCNATLESGVMRKWLVYLGWVALLAICVLSASRSVILGALMAVPGVIFYAIRRPGKLAPIAGGVFVIGLIWVGLGMFDVVGEGVKTHEYRFGSSAAVEGGPLNRVIGFFIPPWWAFAETPWHGYGLGLGTNAGTAYITGQRGFGISEGELHRLVAEMGPLIGGAYLVFRYLLCLVLLARGWAALAWEDPLPLLLISAGVLGLAVGQWGIATSLGFGVFLPGLALAALNVPEGDGDETYLEEEDP